MCRLIDHISGHININLDCMLSEMVNVEGFWNLDIFRLWLPKEIVRHIVSTPPPHLSVGLDKIFGLELQIVFFSLRVLTTYSGKELKIEGYTVESFMEISKTLKS